MYSFLESSLNALYLVYALRKNFDLSSVSIILAQFSFCVLGDKIGRKKVIVCGLIGGLCFFLPGRFAEYSGWLVAAFFLLAGMSAGSMFSLGITYMADITLKELLPTKIKSRRSLI